MVVNNLRLEREKAGLSQVQLGFRAGVANSYISEFERGKRESWPKARRALAEALGVPESELFPEVAEDGR